MSATAPGAAFITLEGIEGAGKSTQMDNIRRQLEAAGREVYCTREPGGTPLAEKLRSLLLDNGLRIGAEEELLLMFAARASHLRETILPALQAGQWVLCDRFTDASYAYQGGGRGLNKEFIGQLESFVQGEVRPDLTIVFDLQVAQGLARAKSRSEADRFEQEEIEFFERIRQTYLERAKARPGHYAVIDASQALDEVNAQVRNCIDSFLKRYGQTD